MAELNISTVSKNYAQALIDVAAESNSYELFKDQLDEIKSVLDSSKDLQIVMGNTSINISKKIDILNTILGDKVNPKIMNFLNLLIEKNRFDEFDSILVSYNEILDKKSNKKNVEIISPIKLNFETKSNVLFKLEHKLNCEVVPRWTVDEDIIAGLTFKFDDYVIDTSIRNKIENLSKNISR